MLVNTDRPLGRTHVPGAHEMASDGSRAPVASMSSRVINVPRSASRLMRS